MSNKSQLSPTNQFPAEAIKTSVQVQPPAEANSVIGPLTLFIASSADSFTAWGTNVKKRDQELRNFWPTESYLAGALANVSMRNAVSQWEIQSDSEKIINAVTDMLNTMISGDAIGWLNGMLKLSQDIYSQDNGGFIEIIRDPGVDANSKFKGPLAPVIGIAHLDSNQCQRTGNSETPILYTDRENRVHKLKWYDVIPFSDFPSPIERMNGVGVSAVSRALRLAQIMRSVAIYKDEEVGGRNVKKINIVGGVGNSQLDDAIKRTTENANNKGNARFIEHAILASLDPEKPVSVATVELASLPEGFDFDQEMQWYISGLALDFGTDYQEFAPLPGGNIGSAQQSAILHKKSSGKGPRLFMDTIAQSFYNYGVLPHSAKMVFTDKNEQEELEKQEVRTKAIEEAAISARSKLLPRKNIYDDLVKRGIYPKFDDIPESFWEDDVESNKNPVGQRGGNTVREDANRTGSDKQDLNSGAALRK